MNNRNVLISGASVAGPAVAYWLRRYGFETTVVERAPSLRGGGHAVDFRGEAHMRVLGRMGILEAIRRERTFMRDVAFVDERGRRLFTVPTSVMSGDVEIERGDLSRILQEATKDDSEYIFGDHVTSLTETISGVDVKFARGGRRTFDLVVGADGLHSGIRALAYGDESKFVRFHGYYVATFTAPNHLGLDHETRIHSSPGRSVSIGSGHRKTETTVMMMFASKPLDYDRHDVAKQKAILASVFAGMGWEVPRLLAALKGAPSLYFDSVSQVDVDRFAKGRVVLLGDAGYGGTLGGQGTGLAIVCSYVLAGELSRAGGDYQTAFARYEDAIRDYAIDCQKGSKRVGPFFAPLTWSQTWLRNQVYRMFTSRPLVGLFEKLAVSAASGITLEDYAA